MATCGLPLARRRNENTTKIPDSSGRHFEATLPAKAVDLNGIELGANTGDIEKDALQYYERIWLSNPGNGVAPLKGAQ